MDKLKLHNFNRRRSGGISRYLAVSYCLMLSIVSSMVLSTSVFTLEMKKLMAPSSVSPFLAKSF